ncbi:MAG: glycerol-3-phosphate 1-O-acyltransferase PlsY [Oscillospiraceae bacterium]|nr:glycerol-3-phosphate 1-O-acyltransferase PlsY [Oscillospiraceae bacterium]
MIAAIVPSYVLGSLNGAIIVSKLFYRKDIRDYGSKNAGLTNFYRVFGKGGAALVFLIDMLKTVMPVLFGGWLFSNYLGMRPPQAFPFGWFIQESFFGQALSGFAVMIGHCFPLFHKFRGGKGVMAIGSIIIVIDWRLALISWGVFILVILITRYVSLGAMLGSIAFPSFMPLFYDGIIGKAEHNVIIMCVILVIIRHIPNIRRLVKGEESKFSLKIKRKHHHESSDTGQR